MSAQYIKPTRVRLTQAATLESARGYRHAIGDTQYGNITMTVPAHAATEGPVEFTKPHTSNTFTINWNGSSCNGQSDPIEITGRSSGLLISGNSEWLLFRPFRIG